VTETLTNAATQDDRTQNEDTKIVIKNTGRNRNREN